MGGSWELGSDQAWIGFMASDPSIRTMNPIKQTQSFLDQAILGIGSEISRCARVRPAFLAHHWYRHSGCHAWELQRSEGHTPPRQSAAHQDEEPVQVCKVFYP